MGNLNGLFVLAGLDKHERLVVSGGVWILIARSRRAELTGSISINLRATEQHPRLEPACRISCGQSVQQGDGTRYLPLLEQARRKVKRPGRIRRRACTALLVVRECSGKLLAREVNLTEVHMRNFIVRHYAEHFLEQTFGFGVPSCSELVDRQVLFCRVERGIDRERFAKAPIGLIGLPGAGQRNAEEIESLQVARGRRQRSTEKGNRRLEISVLNQHRCAFERPLLRLALGMVNGSRRLRPRCRATPGRRLTVKTGAQKQQCQGDDEHGELSVQAREENNKR